MACDDRVPPVALDADDASPAADAFRVRPARADRQVGDMFGPRTFVVRMPDGGMAPQIREGDHMCVDPDEPVGVGRIEAVRDPETGETTAWRCEEHDGRRVLRAFAPGVPEVVVDDGSMILGVVVFAGREL